jgi:DNA-damage-inducible protein D
MGIDLSSIINKLEALKKITKNGGEYWMGRDIQDILGYSSWEKFYNVIERSMIACESSGYHAEDHFHQTGKMVAIGSGAQRQRVDYFLNRYACYLIAMNGDTPETGIAQTYFAVQTRKQEMQDMLTTDEKRIQSPQSSEGNGSRIFLFDWLWFFRSLICYKLGKLINVCWCPSLNHALSVA